MTKMCSHYLTYLFPLSQGAGSRHGTRRTNRQEGLRRARRRRRSQEGGVAALMRSRREVDSGESSEEVSPTPSPAASPAPAAAPGLSAAAPPSAAVPGPSAAAPPPAAVPGRNAAAPPAGSADRASWSLEETQVLLRATQDMVRRGRYNKALLYSDPAVAAALVLKTENQVYDKYKSFGKYYREKCMK